MNWGDKFLSHKKKERDLPAINQLRTAPDINKTHKEIKDVFRSEEAFCKKITIYLLHSYSERPLKEIGAYFSIGESAVSESSKRFEIVLKRNKKLRKEIELLRNKISL